MSLRERFFLFACQNSWSFYKNWANYRVTKNYGTQQIEIPIRLGMGLGHLIDGKSEIGMVLDICKQLGYKSCFVDVGANLGQTFLEYFSSPMSGPYLGFEPDVDASSYLSGLIRLNDVRDAHVLPIALGLSEGNAILHTAGVGWVGATINPSMTADAMYTKQSRVPTSTGDTQLAHIADNSILLIKIDVEGFEMAVLEGLRGTIARTSAPLYVEVLGVDHFLDNSYSRQYFGSLTTAELDEIVEARLANGKAVEEFFLNCDYRLFMFNSKGRIERIDEIDLLCSRPGFQGERNVLALPKDVDIDF